MSIRDAEFDSANPFDRELGMAIAKGNERTGASEGRHVEEEMFCIDHVAVCPTVNNKFC